MPKFFAKIPFASGDKVYAMHTREPHEHDNAEMVKAWEDAGYVEILEKGEGMPKGADEVPGTEDAPKDDFVVMTVEQLKEKYTANELKAIIKERGIEGSVKDKNKDELISMIQGG